MSKSNHRTGRGRGRNAQHKRGDGERGREDRRPSYRSDRDHYGEEGRDSYYAPPRVHYAPPPLQPVTDSVPLVFR